MRKLKGGQPEHQIILKVDVRLRDQNRRLSCVLELTRVNNFVFVSVLKFGCQDFIASKLLLMHSWDKISP